MNTRNDYAYVRFVTSNNGKVASLRKWLKGTNIKVYKEKKKIPLREEKLTSIEDIAVQKVLTVKEVLRDNFVAQDSGFFLEAIPGFPGPNVNHVLSTIGIEGILGMINGKDRTCYFKDVLAFYSPNLKNYFKMNQTILFDGEISTVYINSIIKSFNQDEPVLIFVSKVKGNVSTTPSTRNDKRAWSDLWRIFIPEGFNSTLGDMSEVERKRFDKERSSPKSNSFLSFSIWASNHIDFFYKQKSLDTLLKNHSR